MKVLACSVCGHIEFNEAPAKCLVCRADKEAFSEDASAITSPADVLALTDGDKKHIPSIAICKDGDTATVSVTVGAIEHVMQDSHFIQYLDFYLNDVFVSRTWLSPIATKAFASIKLSAATGKVTVIENCNVHGNWMSQSAI